MKTNTRYQILTDSGFQNFDGLNRVYKEYIKIHFNNGKTIRVSLNHVFIVSGANVIANDVKVGDFLNKDHYVIKIDKSSQYDYLYDPINVENTHSYIADNITHHNCSFIGSSYTLIDGHKIASLGIASPIYNDNNLEIFEEPKKNHSYIISVDTSRGRGLDYSAFSIIDVTKLPYQVVGCYKDNMISTMEYPHLIYNYARQYNDAYILVEVNDIGEEVSNILWYDYEYENLYFTNKDGLTSSRGYPGVRTTSKVKTLGCSVLKDLIEKDQLIVNSFRIIEELGIFVLQRKSYGADDPVINDDLTATLWLFAWLSKQEEFQEATDINIRSVLSQKKQEFIDSMMTPFGFYSDGHDEEREDSSKLPPPGSYELTEAQLGLLG